MELSNERATESSNASRTATSECWVYTAEHGIEEVTLPAAQSSLTVEGKKLRPWCLLDRSILGCALAILYSAEAPSRELREMVTQLARARFANRPWFPRADRES